MLHSTLDFLLALLSSSLFLFLFLLQLLLVLICLLYVPTSENLWEHSAQVKLVKLMSLPLLSLSLLSLPSPSLSTASLSAKAPTLHFHGTGMGSSRLYLSLINFTGRCGREWTPRIRGWSRTEAARPRKVRNMTVRCEGGEDSCRGSEGEAGRGAGLGRRVGGRAAARQPGAAAGEAGGGPAPCRGRGCGGASLVMVLELSRGVATVWSTRRCGTRPSRRYTT